jgi:hypothetical protein
MHVFAMCCSRQQLQAMGLCLIAPLVCNCCLLGERLSCVACLRQLGRMTRRKHDMVNRGRTKFLMLASTALLATQQGKHNSVSNSAIVSTACWKGRRRCLAPPVMVPPIQHTHPAPSCLYPSVSTPVVTQQ